jgi:hypothetical protein
LTRRRGGNADAAHPNKRLARALFDAKKGYPQERRIGNEVANKEEKGCCPAKGYCVVCKIGITMRNCKRAKSPEAVRNKGRLMMVPAKPVASDQCGAWRRGFNWKEPGALGWTFPLHSLFVGPANIVPCAVRNKV